MCLTARYSLLITRPNGYAAAAAFAGLGEGLVQIPARLHRSITLDQGWEWGSAGSTATVDAVVVATAVEAGGAVILTGDAGDIGRLAAGEPQVVIAPV